MNFASLSIEEFCQRLGSAEPAPGGGAAAGLLLKLSAALTQKLCSFTLGRPKYATVEARVEAIRSQAEALSHQASELMDADANAYQTVSQAFKLPKEDDRRERAVSDACKAATEVPLASMRAAVQLAQLADEIGRVGNQTLIMDARAAALFAQAAAEASAGNVMANLPLVKDPGWVDAAAKEAEELLKAVMH